MCIRDSQKRWNNSVLQAGIRASHDVLLERCYKKGRKGTFASRTTGLNSLTPLRWAEEDSNSELRAYVIGPMTNLEALEETGAESCHHRAIIVPRNLYTPKDQCFATKVPVAYLKVNVERGRDTACCYVGRPHRFEPAWTSICAQASTAACGTRAQRQAAIQVKVAVVCFCIYRSVNAGKQLIYSCDTLMWLHSQLYGESHQEAGFFQHPQAALERSSPVAQELQDRLTFRYEL